MVWFPERIFICPFTLPQTCSPQNRAQERSPLLQFSFHLAKWNFFTSCALVERRQLGSLEEHILEHSLSTSFRKCCCRCFRSMGFFHAAVAIWPYVPRHNIFPKLSNPSGSVFTFTLLGQWTYTCTTVLLSSWPCSCMIAGLTEETLGITSNVGLMFFTGVEKWI